MANRTYWRLTDMKTAVTDIRSLLANKTLVTLRADRVTRAAYERFLEVLSEASRHIPEDWKADHPQIPCRQVADLGNHVRHSYQRIDLEILWNVYAYELDAIESVIDQLIARAKPSQTDSGPP